MPMQTTYPVAPDAAVEGALACRRNEAEIDSGYNADAVNIRFGLGVEFASSTLGAAVKLPNAQTDVIKGITVRTHTQDPGERGELVDTVDTGGVKPGGTLSVLRKGTIWVKCRLSTAPGAKLFVRAVAGAGEWLGACEAAADSTDMVDCSTKGEFQTFAAALGLAKLRVNF
jgi:hypothetical protein